MKILDETQNNEFGLGESGPKVDCALGTQEWVEQAIQLGFQFLFDFGGDPATLTTHYCHLENLPSNLESWALSLSQRALVASRRQVESAGESPKVTLVAVPQGSRVFAGLFVGEEETLKKIEEFHKLFVGTPVVSLPSPTASDDFSSGPALLAPSSSSSVAEDLSTLVELNQDLITSTDRSTFGTKLSDRLWNALVAMDRSSEAGEFEVHVGLTQGNGVVKLEAVSGHECLPEDESLLESIESAMAEAVCRNETSSWPPHDTERHALICHRRLLEKTGARRVRSHLVRSSKGELNAVLLVVCHSDLNARQIRFCELVAEQSADRLDVVKRTEKGIFERGLVLLQESYTSQKARFIAKSILVLFLISFIPWPYSLSNDCEILPRHRRFICAPFEAPLAECHVEPGDHVQMGQPLAQLDDREIRLELAKNTAEMNRALKNGDGFLANQESGKARLAELEYEKLAARNSLLKYQIEHLALKSPVDGIVVAGDLKDSIGSPLEKGAVVFEIAPLDEFVVEVFIPEDDVRFAAPGQAVSMGFDALPFRRIRGVIERIHPESQLRNNENVFVARVRLDESVPNMRPGMRGRFRVQTVWRPLIWNWLHKPVYRSLRWVGW